MYLVGRFGIRIVFILSVKQVESSQEKIVTVVPYFRVYTVHATLRVRIKYEQ